VPQHKICTQSLGHLSFERQYCFCSTTQLLIFQKRFCKNLISCVALLRRLAGSGWGVGTTVLRTPTLAMVHSTVENCSPAEYHSAHTRLFHPAINDPLRAVTGCLRPTTVDNLHTLAGIQSAELRRKGATTLSLTRRGMEPGHLLNSAITCPPSRNHGISNQDTHLYPLHNKSSVHLTATTEVRRSGRITDGMRSS